MGAALTMRSQSFLLAAVLVVACDRGGSGSSTGDPGTTEGTDAGETSGGSSNDTTTGPCTCSGTDGDSGTDGTSSATASTDDDGATDEGTDTGAVCEAVGPFDARRVLIENRTSVLSGIGLGEVLGAIATNAGLDPDPQQTHDRLFDTYRLTQVGEFDGRHCDTELVGETPALNGFPLLCPRSEGAFAAFDEALDGWFPTAMVNRIDLAPADGSHCGEQRMIFANPNMVGRAFIIIEAQIPNPSPGCGIAACGPVAEFWSDLDTVDDPAERTNRLRAAFIDGDPQLTAAGFGPFMSADNLTFGSGQVRTNNFVTGPWTLREYKLVPLVVGASTVVRPEPVPVSASPHDTLWNDLMGDAVGPGCRTAMLNALPGLLVDDVATMGWSIPVECRSSESVEFEDFYDVQLLEGSGAFITAIEAQVAAVAPGSNLDAFDVARRAQFAGSCIGCHEHAQGLSLGAGLEAPLSLGFVHVTEEFTEPCGDGSDCFGISPALTDVLLPSRMVALQSVLDTACEQGCAAASVPAVGHAQSLLGLDSSARLALDRAAQPPGLTIGGKPVGAGH